VGVALPFFFFLLFPLVKCFFPLGEAWTKKGGSEAHPQVGTRGLCSFPSPPCATFSFSFLPKEKIEARQRRSPSPSLVSPSFLLVGGYGQAAPPSFSGFFPPSREKEGGVRKPRQGPGPGSLSLLLPDIFFFFVYFERGNGGVGQRRQAALSLPFSPLHPPSPFFPFPRLAVKVAASTRTRASPLPPFFNLSFFLGRGARPGEGRRR